MDSVRLPPGASAVERLAALPRAEREAFIDRLTPDDRAMFEHAWACWGRKAQLAPEGTWRTWLILAGRGFGKTRAGAEWVRARAEADRRLRIALVAGTMAEGRAVMIEGASGLLGIAPPGKRPEWEPSLRRLRWPNGAQAFLYSAAEPESLRGPQHHLAWADEIAKWPHGPETWDNLMMGMRLGAHPRTVATTTPRPVALVRSLIGQPGVVVTRGRTDDNGAHLPASFLEAMRENYAGTRIGRQELDGELIEEVEGALWSRELIERQRVKMAPALRRVVVAVDPPAGVGGDACGIVVAGIGEGADRTDAAFVIADASVVGAGPDECGDAGATDRAGGGRGCRAGDAAGFGGGSERAGGRAGARAAGARRSGGGWRHRRIARAAGRVA